MCFQGQEDDIVGQQGSRAYVHVGTSLFSDNQEKEACRLSLKQKLARGALLFLVFSFSQQKTALLRMPVCLLHI